MPINMDFELLETMRWDPAEGYVLLQRHWDRLQSSAAHFGFAESRDHVLRAMDSAVAGRAAPAKVRLLVGRHGAARCEVQDLTPGKSHIPGPNRLRQGYGGPPKLYAKAESQNVLRVALAAHTVSRRDEFLYHKTTNRAIYERARASRPDAGAVILWNEEGEVTESTEANVVAEIQGRLVTPPVSCGLLAGTMRAELLAQGEVTEAVITTRDLAHATRIWLINSVRGWMESTMVD